MKIGNHEKALVFFLHFHIVLYSPEIIAQVEEARGPDSAHDDAFLLHRSAKIKKLPFPQTVYRNGLPHLPDSTIFVNNPLMQVTSEMVEKMARLARLEFNDADKEAIRLD